MLACLMVECMAASSRWLKVREGGSKPERRMERKRLGKGSNGTDVNYRAGRRAESKNRMDKAEM